MRNIHIIFATYASPDKHEQLKKLVEQLEYDFEGKRKGKTRPFLSEIKLYDVRIKKEVASQFIRDMNILFSEDPKNKVFFPTWLQKKYLDKLQGDGGEPTGYMGHIWVRRLLKLFRWLTPFRHWPRAEGKSASEKLVGWHYAYCIGTFPDWEKDGEELL